MSAKRIVTWLAAAAVLAGWAATTEAGQPKEKARVLFLTQSKGFKHGSVNRREGELAPAEIAITQLGQQTGLFETHCTQDAAADFTAENLKNYDIVMFYTTGELPISNEARDYFVNEWLKQEGHGFIGFHSATDTFRTDNPDHKWYWDLVGGTFNGHPWNAGTTVTITVHDPEHPTMRPFGDEFEFKDEIYQYVHWEPKNVRVLMSLNMAKCKPSKPYHVPVAWCRAWGDGKVFYNNLGHNEATWTDKKFLKSTENAVRWVLGLIEGDAMPNPEVSAEEEQKAQAAAK
ncbi:MAG: ThuA domain-containing protein [Planctomycetes bacterium]|nr:ThuA domain-containing protein [Planctomycetota bacterium]